MQAASYCTSNMINIEDSPMTLSSEKGAARLIALLPYETNLALNTNSAENLLVRHIAFDEDDNIIITEIEPSGEESLLILNNPAGDNHALMITTAFTGEPSENIEFSISATTTFLPGDINGDSTVNIQDIIMQINIILHQIDPTEYQWLAADLDENGVVDILDVILLVDIILS